MTIDDISKTMNPDILVCALKEIAIKSGELKLVGYSRTDRVNAAVINNYVHECIYKIMDCIITIV